MNWLAAALTLAGTIVGASITLIADRVRWRRDQDQRHHQTRRDSYATYLAALHATSDAIRVVSLNEHDPQVSRVSAAVTAFGSAHLTAAREHVALVGPESVVHAADATFRSLRNLRDLLRQGHDLESSEYQQGLAQYQLTLYALRNVMRSDLGNTSIGKLMSHFEFRCDGLASGPESRTLLIPERAQSSAALRASVQAHGGLPAGGSMASCGLPVGVQGRKTIRRPPPLPRQAGSTSARGTSSIWIGRSPTAARAMNPGIAPVISARGMVPGPLP